MINGAAFSEYGFGGDGGGGGETGSETSMGSVGIGGGVVGEMLDNGAGAFGAPTFLFRCISKSPTFNFSSAISVSSQTSSINASNPLGKIGLRRVLFSDELSSVLSSVLAVEVFSDVLALDTTTVTPRHTGGVTRLNDLLAAEGQLLLRTGNTIPGLSNDDPDFATAPTE